jgi:hypothetical protein
VLLSLLVSGYFAVLMIYYFDKSERQEDFSSLLHENPMTSSDIGLVSIVPINNAIAV